MTPCWIWQGARIGGGYGVSVALDGHQTTAHRAMYEIEVGPIPDGHNVLHRCDIRPCVRPDHLFTGTQAENLADMRAKGRQAKVYRRPDQHGERNHAAKLADSDVYEMRRLFAGGTSQADLARRFNTTRANVHCIVRRKSRKEA